MRRQDEIRNEMRSDETRRQGEERRDTMREVKK